jgi:hypothetical protein
VHLEKLLPKIGDERRWHRLVYRDDIERFADNSAYATNNVSEEEEALREKLKKFNMEEWRTLILIDRLIYNKPFAKIAHERKYNNRQHVSYFFQQTLDLLKQKGYK